MISLNQHYEENSSHGVDKTIPWSMTSKASQTNSAIVLDMEWWSCILDKNSGGKNCTLRFRSVTQSLLVSTQQAAEDTTHKSSITRPHGTRHGCQHGAQVVDILHITKRAAYSVHAVRTLSLSRPFFSASKGFNGKTVVFCKHRISGSQRLTI